MRTALIAGATGLVGGACLQQLLADSKYRRVIAIVRRPTAVAHPKLESHVIDFEQIGTLEPTAIDDVFCALGTTIKKAGSQEAFRKVDFEYPKAIAEYAKRFVQLGVRVVGGCCGTTPAHIRAIRDALRTVKPSRKVSTDRPIEVVTEEEVAEPPTREKSRLAARIVDGEFVCSVELVPPRGCDPAKVLDAAQYLADENIDAINIPDSPRASSRMSPLALAVLIENRISVETILHYCCRDRNILGMQSDLLGAHALGLRNILLVTGDPIRTGD